MIPTIHLNIALRDLPDEPQKEVPELLGSTGLYHFTGSPGNRTTGKRDSIYLAKK